MKKYSDYLNQLNINKKLYDMAMSSDKKKNIQRFKESGDFKSILKEINILIDKIREESLKLDYNDINYSIYNNTIEIHYNSILSAYLNTLKEILFGLYDNSDIMNKIFQDGYRDLFLEIDLDKNNFNRIDIINGLPNFMKKLELGKKVYKKLIKDFNYISSFYGYSPSIDSDMVWDSILDDNDIYSFTNDDNIISFYNDFNYDEIITILKQFYLVEGKRSYDDDFLKKYNLSDKKLNGIL